MTQLGLNVTAPRFLPPPVFWSEQKAIKVQKGELAKTGLQSPKDYAAKDGESGGIRVKHCRHYARHGSAPAFTPSHRHPDVGTGIILLLFQDLLLSQSTRMFWETKAPSQASLIGCRPAACNLRFTSVCWIPSQLLLRFPDNNTLLCRFLLPCGTSRRGPVPDWLQAGEKLRSGSGSPRPSKRLALGPAQQPMRSSANPLRSQKSHRGSRHCYKHHAQANSGRESAHVTHDACELLQRFSC